MDRTPYYWNDEFDYRPGEVHDRNGNLVYVEDLETGEGSWRSRFEVDE